MYESIRRDASRHVDVEAQQRQPLDERFHDDDDDPEALLYEAHLGPETMQRGSGVKRRTEEEEAVPESLLLEPHLKNNASRPGSGHPQSSKQARTEAQWKTVQEQHGLHSARPSRHGQRPSARSRSAGTAAPMFQPNPQADAMWLYTNANNLDAFLLEVYQYFVNHGVWSIMLARFLSLLTELFVFLSLIHI